jgi:tetratricopeptide (TPR) repeat protein
MPETSVLSMKRSRPVVAPALALCLFTLCCPALARTQEAPPEIPQPDLGLLEDAVADQLTQARREVLDQWGAPDATDEARGRAYGELGRYYHAYELLDAAAAAYAVAARMDPVNLQWPYGQGLVAEATGDLEGALGFFRSALQRRPGEGVLQYQVGHVLAELGRLEEAQAMLEAAHEALPREPAIVAALGELALQQGQPEQAIDLLTQVLRAVPAANRLHYPLALAYRQTGDMEAAREHLEARGEIGVTINDPFQGSLADLATGELAYLLRGHKAFGAGDFAAAAEAYGQAVQAAPDSARARVDHAAALAQSGRRDEAMAELERAVALDPDNPTAQYNLGRLLELTGKRLPEALERYRRAAELQPEDPEAHFRAGVLMVDLGRLPEAKVYLEAALARHPQDGRLTSALARILAASPQPELRDGPRAIELAQRVVAAQPDAFYVETLAMAFAEAGRCAEAAELQQQLVEAAREAGQDANRYAGDLARYRGGAPCRPPAG